MGEALFFLEQVLRSQKEPSITRQETEMLVACKSKAVREFTLAGSLVGGVVWMYTSKLNSLVRVSLAGGAAIMSGIHRVRKTLDSCANHILSLNGTRMQHELAKIMVSRYGDDPWKMRYVAKHFYSEKVFDDSGADLPKRLYRLRHMYVDNSSPGVIASDSSANDQFDGNHVASSSATANLSQGKDRSYNRTAQKSKISNLRPGISSALWDDPLDYIFGNPNLSEESLQTSHGSETIDPNRRLSRSQRRLNRRHRSHHRRHEKLSDPVPA